MHARWLSHATELRLTQRRPHVHSAVVCLRRHRAHRSRAQTARGIVSRLGDVATLGKARARAICSHNLDARLIALLVFVRSRWVLISPVMTNLPEAGVEVLVSDCWGENVRASPSPIIGF